MNPSDDGPIPNCDKCGEPMQFDDRTTRPWELEDDAQCGISLFQWVCFCNGGNYADITSMGRA